MFNTQDPVMPAGLLESLSKAVGAYATGREISKYLAECSLPDALGEGATKWLRLHNAFAAFQNKHQVSNNILKFTQKVIHPTRFINENDRFEEARLEVNKCLAFIGRELGQSGKLRKVEIGVNALATESQESEHKGFMNLLKGIFGIFRNTTGHAPRIVWQMDEEDALDCLTMVSYAHRKLDGAKLRREH